jgi:hypothetical protein
VIRNPNDSSLQAQIDELRALLRANPLRAASVERGMVEFYENSMLKITDSNMQVVGTEEIYGLLRVVGRIILEGLGILTVNGRVEGSGSFDWTGQADIRGPLTIAGDTDITGNTDVTGDMNVTGELTIDGLTRLLKNLLVEGGGKIIVGQVELAPGVGGSGGLTAPVQIVLSTPLVDVQGGLGVSQSANFEGSIRASGLLPIGLDDVPEGAIVGMVFRDGLDRLRVVVP